MQKVELSPKELDRYDTKLFPPKYHYKYFPFKYRLIVDGKELEQSVALSGGSDGRFSALLWGDAARSAGGVPISELATHFNEIQFSLPDVRAMQLSWAFDFLDIRCEEREPKEMRRVIFKIDQDFDLWSAPFSISDLSAAMRAVVTAHPELGFLYWQGDHNLRKGFGVSMSARANDSLMTILSSAQLLEFENHVEAALARDKLIRLQFEFPSPVRNGCEQYLIYFVQFLRDLGIEAEGELKEDAQKVLFSVKPRDQGEALGKIWKALAVYLQAPGSRELGAEPSLSNDIAVLQWKAQVAHLQGQLHIAAAILQAKDAAIAAKDSELTLLKNMDLRMYLQPEPAPKAEENTNEPLMPFVEVKPLTVKDAVVIDLPAIVRSLKRRF
jgi:hypothetical protein